MNLTEAAHLARAAMNAHDLYGWTFQYNRRKSAFGLTNYTLRTIELSSILTEHADRAQVIQTIGHEIAHALAPGAQHGPAWKAQMRSMGLTPDRCGESNEQQRIMLQTVAKYTLTCSITGKTVATLDRIVKVRRLRDGRRRTYRGHTCKCHHKEVMYNGRTWADIT